MRFSVMRALLSGFTCLCLIAMVVGCKSKPAKPKPDKVRQQYQKYYRIFKDYRTVPLDSTIGQIDSFLLVFPEDARAWAFYGRLMYDADSAQKSIAAYKNAIRFNPRFSEGYAGVGSVYHVLNQADSAEYYLQKAVDLKDSSAYTFLNLSMLCQLTGKNEKCNEYADKAFMYGDSSAAVCTGLSYVYNQQKNKDRSEQMYARAVQLGLTDTLGFKEVLEGKTPIQTFFRNNRY